MTDIQTTRCLSLHAWRLANEFQENDVKRVNQSYVYKTALIYFTAPPKIIFHLSHRRKSSQRATAPCGPHKSERTVVETSPKQNQTHRFTIGMLWGVHDVASLFNHMHIVFWSLHQTVLVLKCLCHKMMFFIFTGNYFWNFEIELISSLSETLNTTCFPAGFAGLLQFDVSMVTFVFPSLQLQHPPKVCVCV